MPIHLGIDETKPDLVVLVHSSDTHSTAQLIETLHACRFELKEFDPVDISQILSSVDSLLAQYKDDEVTINLTGGTKPWAIAFAMQARSAENTRLIYIDQNCVFYDYNAINTAERTWTPFESLDMETLMKYNGEMPTTHSSLASFEDDDQDVIDTIKELRKFNHNSFNKLTINVEDELRKKSNKMGLKDGSYIEGDFNTNEVSILLMGRKYHKREETLASPNVMKLVFNAGWFEYEVAQILSAWSHTKKLWMNVVYKTADKSKNKNEIDIVVNAGLKLLMVECKTQIHNTTDIDKFRSAVKAYGGMGCKTLFITESEMSKEAKEKCEEHSITHFSLLDPAYPNRAAAIKALHHLLDEKLFSNNAR